MARNRRRPSRNEDPRPVAVNDFIYDDPDSSSESVQSDTPDEAIRKLRGHPDPSVLQEDDSADSSDSDAPMDESPEENRAVPKKRKVYSSGIVLDDNLQPVGKVRRSHPLLRGVLLAAITVILLLTVASFILSGLFPGVRILSAPESAVSTVVTPVQSFFSGITESIVSYFRSLKLRANIETAYNELRAQNEQLVYKAMLADELQQTLLKYEDLTDEINANRNMRPIVATVVGKSDANYFSTMTINKGMKDGVEDYMAVTISGSLVGYTENTQAHETTVRTIIDSNASIAAIIQSSRDQGTVRGTLGVDGSAMCRMYYLPDDNLPRPGDLVVTSGVGMKFPKGIPIGIVRESTRGMEANKQYILIEPQVDFQHLEYVIVLRYKPEAEAIEGRENGRSDVELVPLASARPSPVIPQIAASLFDSPTPLPDSIPTETLTPSPTPQESATPTASPTVTPIPVPEETSIAYNVVNLRKEPTPSPTPTYAPTPTPYFTPDPAGMTFEEDN